MDDIVDRGARDSKPVYDPSMSIIGWLVISIVIWAAVLLPILTF